MFLGASFELIDGCGEEAEGVFLRRGFGRDARTDTRDACATLEGEVALTEGEGTFGEFQFFGGEVLVERVVGEALEGEELRRRVVVAADEKVASLKNAAVHEV